MKIYNCIASIIRLLLNRGFELDKALAVSECDTNDIKCFMDILFDADGFEYDDFQRFEEWINEQSSMKLLVLLEDLDKKAAQFISGIWDAKDFENAIIIEDGLNDRQNIIDTDIIILPRYGCIWEGKNREKHHETNINTFMYNLFYVEADNAKVDGKYKIFNHILNPSYFGICVADNNELYLQIAISPITNNVELSIDEYELDEDGAKVNYFAVNELSDHEQEMLIQLIRKIITKADENHDKILVFPEMLGTENIIKEIKAFVEEQQLVNLQLIVLPSVWKKKGTHKNENIAYVIDYEGEELFGQHKLRRFPWIKENKTRLEDIVEGKEVHILYCEGYGSIAIAICRSELDSEMRELLMNKLNVKLILCPSWSSGSYEFENSILTGIERKCNVAWSNTCSAVEKGTYSANVVGIITSFGKSRNYSKMSLDGCRFPDKICQGNCIDGCMFSLKIYGTDYKEGWVNENDG